jgi:hypothetical protein
MVAARRAPENVSWHKREIFAAAPELVRFLSVFCRNDETAGMPPRDPLLDIDTFCAIEGAIYFLCCIACMLF